MGCPMRTTTVSMGKNISPIFGIPTILIPNMETQITIRLVENVVLIVISMMANGSISYSAQDNVEQNSQGHVKARWHHEPR